MSLVEQPTREWRASVVAAAFVVLAGLAFLMTPLGDWLRLRSYDLLFRVRPSVDPEALKDIVILSMDEESGRDLKQDPDRPWDRAVHTRLLKELTRRGARLIVFDVLWNEPSRDKAVDEELAAAIREHGHVVLAAHWHGANTKGLASVGQVLRPITPIGTNAPWGLVEWPLNPGSLPIIRRQFYHPDFPNLPWQAAKAIDKAPLDRSLTYWMNYYGRAGTIPTISYRRVFATNSLPPDFFAGKTVFIGKTPVITSQGQSLDQFPTPYSLWPGGLTSGVEIEATAFLNLVRGEWLHEMPPGSELLLILLLGLLFGWGLSAFRPWIASAMAAAGVLLIALLSSLLTWQLHVWFPWLVICVVQIPCALACGWLAHLRRMGRQTEVLQRDVALAESVARLPELLHEEATLSRPGQLTGASTVTEQESAPPPIPNHQLLQPIGRGAYGEVWLARDEIGTYHAVKVIYLRSFSSAAPYDREFRGIQKFTPISRSHPGFVHILHVGRNDPEGYFFYIMELGDDENAGQQINPGTYSPKTLGTELERRKRLPLPECIQLGLALAGALDYLHQQHLIHRDIKPSNIIFANGLPKFADVGLVTDITPKGRQTTFVGTEGYLPPEGPGTPMADVFSLGKVLYEAATGCDRLQFPTLPGTLVQESSAALREFNEILLKACAPEPRHRYQRAGELEGDLRRLSQEVRISGT